MGRQKQHKNVWNEDLKVLIYLSLLKMEGFIYTLLYYWFLWVSTLAFMSAAGTSFGVRKLYILTLKYIFDKCGEKMIQKETEKWHTGEESIKSHDVIHRGVQVIGDDVNIENAHYKPVELKHKFGLDDITYFAKSGVEAIIQDEYTPTSEPEATPHWNLLTRSKEMPQFVGTKTNILWFLGFIIRYFILLPIRIPLFLFVLVTITIGNILISSCLPEGRSRKITYKLLSTWLYRIFMRSFSAVITYHNREYRAKGGGVCVANHTSPLDIFILGSDNTYAMVGQKAGGLIGHIQRSFNKAESHVWFERTSANDRTAVVKSLKEHISDPDKLPVLIFPEGVCINNTSVVRFKKGSFELGATIYPVAIKYDRMFSDALWFQDDILTHIFHIMTSWAIVCDVWYLPPETIKDGESGVNFANRIKSSIAKQGGLLDVDWDGMLKYTKPSTSLIKQNQMNYSKTIEFN